MYSTSSYAPKEYRRWIAQKIQPVIRRHGLHHDSINPATALPRSSTEHTLIAEEVPPSLAQASLF